jgi:hypothetical protein
MGGSPFFLKVTLTTLCARNRGSPASVLLGVVLLLLSSAGVPPVARGVGASQVLEALVSIVPAELTVDPGATFTVEVTIRRE